MTGVLALQVIAHSHSSSVVVLILFCQRKTWHIKELKAELLELKKLIQVGNRGKPTYAAAAAIGNTGQAHSGNLLKRDSVRRGLGVDTGLPRLRRPQAGGALELISCIRP
ncbi:hypothetical protein CERZMDRAFT_94492 [Cercospora zeae-maydis SCOH1-5]|uniref:Uncharacterized protein n=1 Tax=Cercospora zeae-maydis SCOH1-5 TaxID=717836 RepID=A0A6A6FRN9_9PEZI|nr:hypothetical protein CERZMDRAFT_94492 [Cercospora zeae-maydis SCOH1-5]